MDKLWNAMDKLFKRVRRQRPTWAHGAASTPLCTHLTRAGALFMCIATRLPPPPLGSQRAQQGSEKSWMLQVRTQFKANMREVDDVKIGEQREA